MKALSGIANAAVLEDEEMEGVWVCEEELVPDEMLVPEGFTFEGDHVPDTGYAGVSDLVEVEDNDDEDDLEDEGFEVSVNEQALNGTYQWVDDILVELRGCGQYDRGLEQGAD